MIWGGVAEPFGSQESALLGELSQMTRLIEKSRKPPSFLCLIIASVH